MSNRKKPLVVLTRKLPDPVETRMRELFDARLNIDDHRMTQPEIVAAIKDADVLVPCITDVIDAAAIEQAGPNLKLIANFGNGVDNIDVAAAAKRGITVTNTPNVLTEDTADMTLALLLSVPRRLVEGAGVISARGGQWPGWSPTWMLGRRIWGKRLGIVGMGRIGTAVALFSPATVVLGGGVCAIDAFPRRQLEGLVALRAPFAETGRPMDLRWARLGWRAVLYGGLKAADDYAAARSMPASKAKQERESLP